ncbi:MAG: helix-turn-helix domain-containing protein [Gemmatimonadales bacterium]
MAFVIHRRLRELGRGQKQLARAARVTESYISQLLRRKKAPPDPHRTDIYDRMDRFLELPQGELARLAAIERTKQLTRYFEDGLPPLFEEVRALVLKKCHPDRRAEVQAIFEQQPFGELERLVTQKLLDVVKDAARVELENPAWIRRLAKRARRSYEEMRVSALELLDADVFDLSNDNCISFLEPLVASWDVDLDSFALSVTLDERTVAAPLRRFEIVERPAPAEHEQPGFREFLADPAMSAGAAEEELQFLRDLPLGRRQPTSLFYYRTLQNLRDPVHFRAGTTAAPDSRAAARHTS